MTADTPTRAQRFAAVVAPAAQRAGYTGRGANAQLARDAGIPESTVSRMMLGKTIPDVKSFEPLAKAIGLSVRDLLVEAEIVSAESLNETAQSPVRSQPVSLEDAADELGIDRDPIARQMFYGVVERLRRDGQQSQAPNNGEDNGRSGGVAAEQ
ncbi:helix-turn-helix domain-containing protein [Streptomyces platensis]|uniref:helix-turn-helix domain-containing protein n=1 Tax=Streptomyces platensis TaxID=58346 RepID=UPI0037A8A169